MGVSMIFFGSKNDSFEYKNLEEYKNNINNLLDKDKYISRKEYINFLNANKEIYEKLVLMDKESVLAPWCKKQKTNYDQLKHLMKFYENTNNLINEHNDNFIGNCVKC